MRRHTTISPGQRQIHGIGIFAYLEFVFPEFECGGHRSFLGGRSVTGDANIIVYPFSSFQAIVLRTVKASDDGLVINVLFIGRDLLFIE